MLERILGEGQDRMTAAETGRRCRNVPWVGSRRLNLTVVQCFEFPTALSNQATSAGETRLDERVLMFEDLPRPNA